MKKLGIMMILAITAGAYMAFSAGSDIVIVDPTNRVQQCGPVSLTNPTNQFAGYTGTFQIVYINGTNIMPLILAGGGSIDTSVLTNLVIIASNTAAWSSNTVIAVSNEVDVLQVQLPAVSNVAQAGLNTGVIASNWINAVSGEVDTLQLQLPAVSNVAQTALNTATWSSNSSVNATSSFKTVTFSVTNATVSTQDVSVLRVRGTNIEDMISVMSTNIVNVAGRSSTNYMFSAYSTNTAQTFTQNTYAKAQFDVALFNNGGAFNTSSNGFICPSSGYYHFEAGLKPITASRILQPLIYTNGNLHRAGGHYANGGVSVYIYGELSYVSTSVYLPSGCVVQVYVYNAYFNDTMFCDSTNNWFTGWRME